MNPAPQDEFDPLLARDQEAKPPLPAAPPTSSLREVVSSLIKRVDKIDESVSRIIKDLEGLRGDLAHLDATPKAPPPSQPEGSAPFSAHILSKQVRKIRQLTNQTRKDALRVETGLDAVRSQKDLARGLEDELRGYRTSQEYDRLYSSQTPPLVSVTIATYNRVSLLTERCLPSVLAQDYPHFEVIVVGDGCTDETEKAIARFGDSRLRFVNLPARESYPDDPYRRWLVAGTAAANRGLELARGSLLTHLDDDDTYPPQRLRVLVDFLLKSRAELVWHPFHRETAPGEWTVCTAPNFRITQVTTGSVIYHSWFKRIPWDPMAHSYLEPGDWNRFRKLLYLGARLARYPEPLLWHYKEHTQDSRSV